MINTNAQASAPNPSNWKLIRKAEFEYAYVLEVEYPGCTNFEGRKIMVYKGSAPWNLPKTLDPHFSDEYNSPIVRFSPKSNGWELACKFAKNYY